ncbi:MAG: peptide ABC transporter substrate-binding protein [Ruminococcaceae bacterium]|nr:peptide ABC transporter substrate-binding protein [Oscillospiraceae bacterium]
MKKLLAMLLAIAMVLSLTACFGGTEDPTEPTGPSAEELYLEESRAVYNKVLGEFYSYYQEALKETDVPTRYAKMAVAEAKMLAAGIFLPTTSQGGNYAMTKIAPYTNTPILFGNDTYRFHDRIVTKEAIKAEDVAHLKAKWAEVLGTGTYEQYVKDYLTQKGYTIEDTATFYFDADVTYWDVLATSYAADSEILVNTYDGLMEYDMENTAQFALATEYTISEDGLKYTFKIREGVKWVDSQKREVATLTANDFVFGMKHMMRAGGGLEYLVCAGCANIVNADAYVNEEINDFSQVGVKALDDYTLEYTLSEPTPYFLTMLGYGVFAPLNQSFYESMGGNYGTSFDTIAYCGPYVITSYTSNNSITLESNPTYWNKDGNNLKSFNYMYTDGTDHQKMYDDFFNGVVDTLGMTTQRVEIAKAKGTFDTYAYVSDTDATTYCGFLNLNRNAYASATDAAKGVSPKTDAQKANAEAAMLNQHFRLAVVMSIDRATYNAQSVGEELKLNSLVNSYTPGTYVKLDKDVTIKINGEDKTFKAGTQYGEIVQAQLDADGVALKVWNGSSSSGFDGWYNVEAAQAELAKAIEDLKAEGIEISAENPIYLDFCVRADSEVSKAQKQVMKQSIEAASNGCIKVNLVEYATRDDYLADTYRFNVGSDANYDLSDGSGWGPDYGDPSTYLGTMLPDYAGYMTKSLGIF